MRNLITIFLLVSVLCLAWQYREATDGKAAAEARIEELKTEVESLKTDLKSAKAQITQLSVQAGTQPGAKPNWLQEKIRSYQSPLTASPGAPGGSGKGRLHGATPTPPPASR